MKPPATALEYVNTHTTLTSVTFLVLMVLLPYWKLTTMQGIVVTDDVFTSDIMNESFPYRHYIGEVLRNGQFPTWLPYIYGGIPLLARAEAGGCYPFNLVLFALFPPAVVNAPPAMRALLKTVNAKTVEFTLSPTADQFVPFHFAI